MQHEKRDSIVRCGSAINNERHYAIRRHQTIQKNTRYDKPRQTRPRSSKAFH